MPSASIVLWQGVRMMPLVKSWSTTTKRESKLLERGRSVIKSMETVEKGSEFFEAAIGFKGGEVG